MDLNECKDTDQQTGEILSQERLMQLPQDLPSQAHSGDNDQVNQIQN